MPGPSGSTGRRKSCRLFGLPDPAHTVLKLYGQEVKIFKLGRMPAQMLIDRSGTLRYVHYGHSMADIPPNEEILDLIRRLNLDAYGDPR